MYAIYSLCYFQPKKEIPVIPCGMTCCPMWDTIATFKENFILDYFKPHKTHLIPHRMTWHPMWDTTVTFKGENSNRKPDKCGP